MSPNAGPRMLVLAASVLLCSLTLIPIWLVRIPPVVDYPNHLARMHILTSRDQSAWLTRYYEIHWAVLPNLGMDLVVPPLAHVVSVETAGKLFLSLLLILLAGGVIALHVALHGRWSLWPLLSFFFLYNSIFLWGFLNYLWGLALALWSFAAWIALRDRPAWLTLPLCTACTTAIFFSHLFALGAYGLFVGGYELNWYWRHRHRSHLSLLRPIATAAGSFIVPCLLLALSPMFHTNPEDIPSWLRDVPTPHGIEFANPLSVLEGFKGTIRTDHAMLDRLTALLLIGLIGLGLITKYVSIAPSMYGPLIVTMVVVWCMPTNLFTASYAEIRLPVAWILLAIAATDVRHQRSRWVMTTVYILVALFLVRMAVVAVHWEDADRRYQEFIRALEVMPEGGRLFSAIRKIDGYNAVDYRQPSPIPTENLACWAVISKSALVSVIFSSPNQQPLRLAAPYRTFFTTGEFVAHRGIIEWPKVLAQYQFVLVRRGESLRQPIPDILVPAFSGEYFVLYRWPNGT